MPLNEQKGNMYPFVSHTFNPIKGRCSHECEYCYMKRFKLKELRLVTKELETSLGIDNFIFVGSSTDMFAEAVPSHWIHRVLNLCNQFDGNRYLFQTKNPERFGEFYDEFPPKSMLATTIESTRSYYLSQGPHPARRFVAMRFLPKRFEKMVSIEPIVDFELRPMVRWIKVIKPLWVNIGADSKGHNLPEPPAKKVRALIAELEKITEVKVKRNLGRLLREEE